MTPDPDVEWRAIIDDVVLHALVAYAEAAGPAVRTLYLTGSYTQGRWNPKRPNVNAYFIARSEDATRVRSELSGVFSEIRRRTRERGVDFLVDCHPFTISQRDTDWMRAPLLTLTTKVFDESLGAERLGVSPTIGYGWWVSHRVLYGQPDALAVFASPPPRDEAWFRGAHEALCHYRRMLDHLPWAIDPEVDPHRFLEETCRYAEEAIKDGVHFGATDAEVADASELEVLHHWAERARDFYADRYGPEGVWAVDFIAALKESVLEPVHDPAQVRDLWQQSIQLWEVVWARYVALAGERRLPSHLTQVLAWM